MALIADHTVDQITSRVKRVSLMVAMRDGIRLATDVYWADAADLSGLTPGAVLLERSPYDVRATRMSDGVHAGGTPVTPESGAAYFAERGYVVIRQDCRGRGRSEGAFSKYVGEANDGYDTHEWLASQPWCDGRIVTQGVSYSAHTQTAAASVGARGIAAMVVDSGGFSDAWEAGGRFGGAFELKQVTWAYRRLLQRPEAARSLPSTEELGAWLRALPWHPGYSPFATAPEYERFVFDQWAHEDRDAFWTAPGLCGKSYYEAFPDAPGLSMSSWYDPYVFTAIDNYTAFTARDPRSRLVMGPWTHGARSVTYAGDVDFGHEATLDDNLDDDYLRFKARWIEAVLTGRDPESAPVTYFVMGGGSGRRDASGRLRHGGSWATAAQWPPETSWHFALHLTADQRLSVHEPDRGEISFDFDPRDPVPSCGGGITSGEPFMRGGAFDQSAAADRVVRQTGEPLAGIELPLAARQDVVSFATEPLEEAVLVAGEVRLELDFSSDAPDTDITAKLIDVYPPSDDYPAGFAMNITDGMLRCRYRNDPAHPEPLEPGKVYRMQLRLPDTANLFAAGHRIRLDISSSNFPRCDVNPNTGRRVLGDRTWQVARNTLHCGRSALRLSVIQKTAPVAETRG